MSILLIFLLVIFVIASILLVLIILTQDDGTEGAGIIFGSAASQQYGAKKGNVVTKTTGILATVFILLAFSMTYLFQSTQNSKYDDIISDTEQSTDSVDWWSNTADNTSVPLDAPSQSLQKDLADGSSDQIQGEGDAQANPGASGNNSSQTSTTQGTENTKE